MIFHRCIVCSSLCKKDSFLCPECGKLFEESKFDSFMDRCPKCYYPILNKTYICPRCSKKEFDFKIYSIADYSNHFARRLLERYKFSYEKKLLKFFAYEYSLVLDKLNVNKENTFIVPIPCSKTSLRKRGWDQMLEIAKHMNKYGYKCIDIIINNAESNVQQKQLTKEERAKASDNKYTVRNIQNNFIDKDIIIIDDVITTGSTLNTCYKLLYSYGFNSVQAVTYLCEL